MSDAQTKALADIKEILGEHFHAGVVVVELSGPTADKSPAIDAECTCTHATAIGLMEIAKDMYLHAEE